MRVDKEHILHDSDTDIVTAAISRLCNEFACYSAL